MSYVPVNMGHQLPNMPNVLGQSTFVPQPTAQSTFVPQPAGQSMYMPQPAVQSTFVPQSVAQSTFVPQSAGHSTYMPQSTGQATFVPQPTLYVMPNQRGNMRNNRRKRRGTKKAKDQQNNATAKKPNRVEVLESQVQSLLKEKEEAQHQQNLKRKLEEAKAMDDRRAADAKELEELRAKVTLLEKLQFEQGHANASGKKEAESDSVSADDRLKPWYKRWL